jgi:hypothetical protein
MGSILQPFFDALNTRDPRVRVLPHFAVDETMLGPDGVSLLDPHSTTYVTFLAGQIADLIAYFESRHHRANGDVTIDDRPVFHLDRTQMTPPLLHWGTPNTSGFNNNSTHSTPNTTDPPAKPQSGVCILVYFTNLYAL